MGFLTAVTGIIDASTGKRVDTPRPDKTFLPVQIALDSSLTYTVTNDGRTSNVTIGVASGSGYVLATRALTTDGTITVNGSNSATLAADVAFAVNPALSITSLTTSGNAAVGGFLDVAAQGSAPNPGSGKVRLVATTDTPPNITFLDHGGDIANLVAADVSASTCTINSGAIPTLTTSALSVTTYATFSGTSAPSAPSAGKSTLFFDSGSSLWKFRNNGGSATAFATATDLASYVATSAVIDGAHGGTGQSTTTAGDLLYGAGSNTWAKLATGGTSTILHGGSVPSWGAVALGTEVSGTLPTGNGGTGLTSWTAGDLPYYATGTALSKLAAGSSSQVLVGGTAPSWGAVALASMVSGTLPIGNGGLGFTTAAQGDIFYASAANTPAKLTVGGANTVLVGGGTTPAYSASPTVTGLTTTNLTVNGSAINGYTQARFAKGTSDATPATGTAASAAAIFSTAQARLIDVIFKNEGTAITADNTNYAAINVIIYDTSHSVVATFTVTTQATGTGAMGSKAAYSVTKFSAVTGSGLSSSVSYASSNYTAEFTITKFGTGITLGPLEVFVLYIP